MSCTTRDLLLVVAALIPFALLALIVSPLLALEGGVAWLSRGAFLLLGAVAAVIVFIYLRARRARLAESDQTNDVVEASVREATRRLASSGKKGLRSLPLVLVVGPSGSAKTTAIVRSGLEPELLAGEVQGPEGIMPTRTANFWFVEGAVLVEVGGALAAEPSRWRRLVRHLRPARLGAVLPGGTQAPRVAVVCFGCDALLDPGAAGAVQAAARGLRAQLLEVAARHGVRLPVYVLFTKADRLPGFAEYVRSFTTDEAAEVLGATLPVPAPASTGSWAEREAGRVASALDHIFRALAQRRLESLRPESAEDVRAGAYEFPREFRKLAPVATQFLVDLCRPSQLGASPFLRGFYFSGVRAVVTGGGEASGPATVETRRTADATAVFDPVPSSPRVPSATPGEAARRTPQWLFLRRVFEQVVLRDEAARALTAGGAHVDLLRRALMSGGIAALVLLSFALLVSWRANSRVLGEAAAAARDIERIDLGSAAVPALEDLERLDALRAQLERLRIWEARRPPLSHRWGLYVGAGVRRSLRPLYFERFERMLWAQTRGRLLASLDRLPETPTEASEYGVSYDALRAHLITTSYPRESTADFLVPELMRHWLAGGQVDEVRAGLVERQFAFFAVELPDGNPFRHPPDDRIVSRTRDFLRQFGNLDQFYQALITEASKVAAPVRFPETTPVSVGAVVQGAYTAAGWDFVQHNLQNLDQLLERERWVLGDAAVPEGARPRIASELRARFITDYVKQWLDYLAAGRVASFTGAADAAAKLRALSGPQSPLLGMLATASHNTSVDSAVVGRAFQPLHAVAPPGAERLIVEGVNQAYMQGLVALQVALDQIVAAPPGPARESALGSANAAAERIKVEVQQMAHAFNPDGDAQPVAAAVVRLLMAPVRNAETLIPDLAAPAALPETALQEIREHITWGEFRCDRGEQALSRTEYDQARRKIEHLLARYPAHPDLLRLRDQVEQRILQVPACRR